MATELRKITRAEVALHKTFKDGVKDVWCIFEGKVYDISSFIEDHPGGEEVLLDGAGEDITQKFADIGHSDYAKKLMDPMVVGILDADSPAPAPAEKPKAATPAPSSSSAPAKKGESSMLALAVPVLVVVVSVLAYMYYGRAH